MLSCKMENKKRRLGINYVFRMLKAPYAVIEQLFVAKMPFLDMFSEGDNSGSLSDHIFLEEQYCKLR